MKYRSALQKTNLQKLDTLPLFVLKNRLFVQNRLAEALGHAVNHYPSAEPLLHHVFEKRKLKH